jgi:hypothetical protein
MANPKYTAFIGAARQLFTVGRAVIYDPLYKTLLSHAGGVSPSFFHDRDYYTEILAKITPTMYSKTEYYDMIELARNELMTVPKSIVGFDPSLLNIYNEPIIKCAGTLFDVPGDYPPLAEYFLVQALGLKGDDGRPFASFINSCDIVPGCNGPIEYKLGEASFFKDMVRHVTVISHGHVPNCTPLPLVYRREAIPGIIFIDNDTSNGYRPLAGIKDITNLPLAYVTAGGQRVGVFSISPDGKRVGTTYFGSYDKMVGEWGLMDAPVHKGGPVIEYAGKNLTFTQTTKPPYVLPKMAGGTRRYKKSKKSKRRNTRR